jgi:hypothetical protein
MREKDFTEEFFLHVVKTKQAKQAKRRDKRIHKVRKKIKKKLKEKEKEIEKIREHELRPELRHEIKPGMKITERKKPPIEPIPVELEHAPEPPAELLMSPPKVPEPKLSLPRLPKLPQPPKFFETGVKIHPSLNLGKLNDFITDPTIQAIQCDGSFMPLKILKKDETIDTDIELNDREITDIINAFARHVSKEVKGPVFKASIKGLMISAVVSEFIGTKFIITKK